MTNTILWYNNGSERFLFTWIDYLIFIVTLGISALVGVYFGFFGPKQDNRKTYLMGGKNMNYIPVGLSLVASQISGVTLLAIPADVYKYGATIWLLVASKVIVFLINYFIFLPIFFKLQLTSIYEYFNIRFDKNVRVVAAFLYTLTNFVYIPIVIYIPALSFSYVSGIYVHYVSALICGVCVFYTTIGGLKAVIWTDAIQALSLIGSTVAVFILGILSVGGFTNMWKVAEAGDRLTIDVSWDPTLRESLWIILIGATFHNITHYSINQCHMQKYLSVDTLKKARRITAVSNTIKEFKELKSATPEYHSRDDEFDFSPKFTTVSNKNTRIISQRKICLVQGYGSEVLRKDPDVIHTPSSGPTSWAAIIYVTGCCSILSFSVLIGITMYAKYKDCDPVLSNQIPQLDQMVTYFTMDVSRNLPGVPGIFIAGIFSASLSTLSATLNTISSNVYEDLIVPFISVKPTEKTISYILKAIVVVAGIVSLGLVFAIEKLGGMFPVLILLEGIPNGALLGLFLVGIFIPWVNARGAFCGAICGFIFLIWMSTGNLWYKSRGLLKDYPKPLSIDGCVDFVNYTITGDQEIQEPFYLYRLSIWYNTFFSATIVIVVSSAVTLTSKIKEMLNRFLFFIQKPFAGP
ncbi:hypothetical protein FQR65_LT12730 [Abscondita terminalis]|nr:hypothetical protein FQR65_LT12730 [Abscondita terminalis]